MNHIACQAHFLAVTDNRLPDSIRAEFESHLAGCPRCAREFNDFQTVKQQLSVIADERWEPAAQAVSQVVGLIASSKVNASWRSSIMRLFSSIFRYLSIVYVAAVVCFFAACIALAVIVATDPNEADLFIRLFVGRCFLFLEGSGGAIAIWVAIFAAVIAATVSIRNRTYRRYSPVFATLALFLFVGRSMVSLFFGYDFEDYEESAVAPSSVTQGHLVAPFQQPQSELVRRRLEERPSEVSGTLEFLTDKAESFERRLQQIDENQSAVAPPALFNREGYSAIVENEYLDPRHDPLSTFSIDVDTASYANTRRFITNGQLPPLDAVRIEELINYFSYDYPDPKSEDPIAFNTEVSAAPWAPAHRLVHIGVQAKRIDQSKLPPSNFVFLIDTSGSMDEPNKLPLVQRSLELLTEQLRSSDRVAIVAYAGAAGLVLPSTPGSNRETIRAAINNLSAGGSTAGGAGIQLAYAVARENLLSEGNNRVILATDGDFNVGVTSDGELVRLIEEERKSGVFLSVLGYGTGNYQDAKMEQLADKGNGNFAYIDSIREAQKVLVEELGGTLVAVAKDVKIQIEFNPSKVKAYRLIGYENRRLAKEDFNDDVKDAGEMGAGHSVTALYEIIPAGSEEALRGVDELHFQNTAPEADEISGNDLMVLKLRYKQPEGESSKLLRSVVADSSEALDETSEAFRFASAVAEFGLLLRDSKFKGSANFAAVIERAKAARGEDTHGDRAEFIRLAETARLLKR